MRIDKGSGWRAAVVACAVAAGLVPLPPAGVNRWYTARFYAGLQPLLTSISNLFPFSLLDGLIAAAALTWVVLAVRDLRKSGGRVRGALAVVTRTVVWCAVFYLLFLALWGLNYRRPRMRDMLPYDASAVTANRATAAARVTVQRLNALHEPAHASGWPDAADIDPHLADGFARAVREAGIHGDVVPARPKPTLLDWYFRRAGVDGMTDPFFLETLIPRHILPFERPFIVAHEWSHLAGIADEGEANFAAWRSCVAGSTSDAYSGWLFLYGELARAVPKADRAALSAELQAGPHADLAAIRDRYQRDVDPRVSGAGWRVYDSYLKANRVDAGTASYDEVVRLVLGIRVNGRPVIDLSGDAR